MRIRVTVKDRGDRTDDLRVAARVRGALWAHSPLEVDPDNPLHGTHRDSSGRAYFEFLTNLRAPVDQVLQQQKFADLVDVSEVNERLGEACQNCGNIAGPTLPPVCPNCGFRDVSECPVCHHEISRQDYMLLSGTLFRCPNCHNRVRLRFNEPMFLSDGTYNQPLVVVQEAGARP